MIQTVAKWRVVFELGADKATMSNTLFKLPIGEAMPIMVRAPSPYIFCIPENVLACRIHMVWRGEC